MIKCPCCNSLIDPKQHWGIIRNQFLYYSSQEVIIQESIKQFNQNTGHGRMLTAVAKEQLKLIQDKLKLLASIGGASGNL